MKDNAGSQDRFASAWTTYAEIRPEYEEQFLKWVCPLVPGSFRGKKVLDAGCGTGRNSWWPLRYGAREVDSFDDAPETVEVARRNLASFPNSRTFVRSIYDPGVQDEYDIVLCIGVVHHLAHPREAVKRLFQSTRPGGILLIWVYGYEGNEWIVRGVNPLRNVASRLPFACVNLAARLFSLPLHLASKAWGGRHPYFEQLSRFSVRHVHSIVVDQLIPRIAKYWTRDEACSLFDGLGARDLQAHRVNNNSWTVVAQKQS